MFKIGDEVMPKHIPGLKLVVVGIPGPGVLDCASPDSLKRSLFYCDYDLTPYIKHTREEKLKKLLRYVR